MSQCWLAANTECVVWGSGDLGPGMASWLLWAESGLASHPLEDRDRDMRLAELQSVDTGAPGVSMSGRVRSDLSPGPRLVSPLSAWLILTQLWQCELWVSRSEQGVHSTSSLFSVSVSVNHNLEIYLAFTLKHAPLSAAERVGEAMSLKLIMDVSSTIINHW